MLIASCVLACTMTLGFHFFTHYSAQSNISNLLNRFAQIAQQNKPDGLKKARNFIKRLRQSFPELLGLDISFSEAIFTPILSLIRSALQTGQGVDDIQRLFIQINAFVDELRDFGGEKHKDICKLASDWVAQIGAMLGHNIQDTSLPGKSIALRNYASQQLPYRNVGLTPSKRENHMPQHAGVSARQSRIAQQKSSSQQSLPMYHQAQDYNYEVVGDDAQDNYVLPEFDFYSDDYAQAFDAQDFDESLQTRPANYTLPDKKQAQHKQQSRGIKLSPVEVKKVTAQELRASQDTMTDLKKCLEDSINQGFEVVLQKFQNAAPPA